MSVFRGDGAGDFGWEDSRPELAAGMTGAVAADFDVDGFVDLLVATDPASAAAGDPIVFGDGTGQFTGPHALPRTSAQPGLVGDLDGDAKPDYVQNTTDGIRVFMNRWDGRPRLRAGQRCSAGKLVLMAGELGDDVEGALAEIVQMADTLPGVYRPEVTLTYWAGVGGEAEAWCCTVEGDIDGDDGDQFSVLGMTAAAALRKASAEAWRRGPGQS